MSYYGKLCTMIYDLDKPFAVKDEIELYTNSIDSKQARILEPMCGSGRFYIPLLKEGYNITGFDLSQEMLNSCIKKCSKLEIEPKVFKADIVKYKSKEKYDYVFIPIGSISLIIDESDLLQSFINIFECLEKKGIFIFSFLNFNSKAENIPDWKEIMRYSINGKEIVCKQKLNYIEDSKLLDIKLLYELIQNDTVIEKEKQYFPIKLYNEKYLQEKLFQVGFNHVEEIKSSESNAKFTIFKCTKG